MYMTTDKVGFGEYMAQGYTHEITLAVKKGDVVHIVYGSISDQDKYFRFTYAQGSEND